MILALAGVAASGCAGPKLYVVNMELESRRVLQTANAEPAPEAREIVKTAASLAFNPPDVCTDVKAAGAGLRDFDRRSPCPFVRKEHVVDVELPRRLASKKGLPRFLAVRLVEVRMVTRSSGPASEVG